MGTHPIFESDFDCLTAMSLTLSIIDAKSKRPLTQVERLNPATSTVGDVKDKIAAQFSVYYKDRQALKNEPKGKMLSDDTTLASLGLSGEGELFFKDLGPQIGWGTVFLAEYAGPLLIYFQMCFTPLNQPKNEHQLSIWHVRVIPPIMSSEFSRRSLFTASRMRQCRL